MSTRLQNNKTPLARTPISGPRPKSERRYLLREQRYGYLATRNSLRSLGNASLHAGSWRRFTRRHPLLAVSGVVSLGALAGSLVIASSRRRERTESSRETGGGASKRGGRIRSWVGSSLVLVGRMFMFSLLRQFTSEMAAPSHPDHRVARTPAEHEAEAVSS